MSGNIKKKRSRVRGKFHVRHNPEKMKFEEERRATFKTWSKTCPILPGPLAEAGFYYVGIRDRVKCFSCGGLIEGWENGDTAMGEHERMYPHCDMVKNQDRRNVPILIDETKGVGTDQTDGQVTRRMNLDNVDASCGTSFTGRMTRAKYPLLTKESERLGTFRDKWSNTFELAPAETKWLANAGFFYVGPGDRTTCFYCGGSIECWEEDDEPWSEHARNFPKCEWLLQMKGKNFVNEVQEFFKNEKANEEQEKNSQDSPSASTLSSNHQNTPVSGASKTGNNKEVSAAQLVKMMGCPTVKTIMKIGFDAALVCQVLEVLLRKPDVDFSSSDNFIKVLEALVEMKDSADERSVESLVNKIEMQAQRFANLEIKSGHRQVESSKDSV